MTLDELRREAEAMGYDLVARDASFWKVVAEVDQALADAEARRETHRIVRAWLGLLPEPARPGRDGQGGTE